VPELPEVEHAASLLRGFLAGRHIVRAEAPRSRVFRDEASRRAFVAKLRGRRFEVIDRRGKYMLLTFDGGVGLLAHLGMTGSFERAREGAAAPPHSRAQLHLDDGHVIHYRDPRMFGRIAIHTSAELLSLPEIAAIGPDPLRDGVDAKVLHAALSATKRPLKVALMDGAVIAGLGNIHATEALWRAKLHPARRADSLSRTDASALKRGIDASITFAIEQIARETAPEAPLRYVNDPQNDENPFLVYDRAGEPCPRRGCKGVLESMVLGGRTSAFCPTCQK